MLQTPAPEQYACRFALSYEPAVGGTELAVMRMCASIGLPYPFYPRGVRSYALPEL